jgi:hypothetical protein
MNLLASGHLYSLLLPYLEEPLPTAAPQPNKN